MYCIKEGAMVYSLQGGRRRGTWLCCLVIFFLSFTVVAAQLDSGSASIEVDPTDLPNTPTPETFTPTLTPETKTPTPTPASLTPEPLAPNTSAPATTSPATTFPATTPPTTSTPTPTSSTPTTTAPSPTTSSPTPTITLAPDLTVAPGSSTSSSGSSSKSESNKKASSSLGLAEIIGIAVGCVILMILLIAFFIVQRRRHKNRYSEASSDNILGLPTAEKKVKLLDTEHGDVTRTTADFGSSMQEYRATLSQDPVILASRIPIDSIELGAVIGRGAFGEVYRGRYRGQEVAVKDLVPEKRKDMEHIEAFLSEVKLMATMEHPNRVQFIGVAWEALSDLFCVIEFMTGGDLRTLMKEYHASGVPQGMDVSKMQIAHGVAHALTYLHSLEPVILHRDLKSRNILLTESLTAKITDFGASRIRSDATMTSNVGSLLWMAPEVMMGRRYDEKADIFSLGVVIPELDTQELPYAHDKEGNSRTGHPLSDTALLQMVSMGKLRVHFSPAMHPDMIQFVERCVSVDPRERPTAAEVLYYLQVATRNKQF